MAASFVTTGLLLPLAVQSAASAHVRKQLSSPLKAQVVPVAATEVCFVWYALQIGFRRSPFGKKTERMAEVIALRTEGFVMVLASGALLWANWNEYLSSRSPFGEAGFLITPFAVAMAMAIAYLITEFIAGVVEGLQPSK